MPCPGKPHQAPKAVVSLFIRRGRGLSFAAIILTAGLFAPGLIKSAPTTFTKTTPQPATPTPATKSAASAPAVPLNYADFKKNVQPFLSSHCYDCHSDTDSEGEVRFDLIHDDASLAQNVPTLEKAVKMLTARKMPPMDQPRPTEDEYHSTITWMSNFTDNFYSSGPINPGRVTIHRLNRAEYDNTIRDLFGFTAADDYHPADTFPADDSGFGFDNNGEMLTIAPVLFEKYIKAAQQTLDKAVFTDPSVPPPVKEWDDMTTVGSDIPKDEPPPPIAAAPANNRGGNGPAAPLNYGRVLEHYGSFYVDYNFPVDGDYVFSLKGYASGPAAARGATAATANVLFYVDDQPVTPERAALKVGARANAPAAYEEPKFHVTAGQHRIYISFRNGASVDDFKAALAANAANPTPAPDPSAVIPPPLPAPADASAPAAAATPADANAAPAVAAASAAGTGGNRRNGFGGAAGAAGTARLGAGARGGRGPIGPQPVVPGSTILGVTSIKIEGPLFTNAVDMPERMPQSYHTVMAARPSDTLTRAQAAEKIIRSFTTRAYRRPVTDEEVKGLLDLFNSIDTPDRPFEKSMTVTLQAVLLNTNFLFRVEQEPQPGEADNTHTLNEYELASRLSYFLWSSMPDDELFNLAAKGQLRANLDAQISRMLKDPKADALMKNFAVQWLQLRKVDDVNPDTTIFKDFDPALKPAMLKETELFFNSIKDEDHSVLDFIGANYSFVNAPLAKLYGLDGNFTDDNFQRVTFPKDSVRGGLVTQASILAITSYNNRTSPVQRGKWVLENLLDAAPPPPPANVPALDGEKELTGTLKERMEMHRANPACAACHERMDAIGFSLENFDVSGAWRTKDTNNDPIDATGSFPDGTKFDGALQLKQSLMASKDQFCRCLADKMLTYAIGRGIEPYDKRTIDTILSTMHQNGDKFSALIKAIVVSDAFQKRRGIEPGDNS
ncbi:MAG TPA: DUF1592 domain-containing protein [Opitutales bacterium]|jgi:hypothetical protein|nr:DUF1592 domain-containing protein [Opitutales bacterium]